MWGRSINSPIFFVPKASGDLRPGLDLRSLNLFMDPQGFRMEFIYTIISVIKPNDRLISIDLADAYLHIPINKHHQRYKDL